MSAKLVDLKKDIEELQSLQSTATRQKVKDILSIEIRKLVTEVNNIEELLKKVPDVPNTLPTIPVANTRCYEVKLSNYAWDQSARFVKFYVSLLKVHSLESDTVYCNFTKNSFALHVKNLENKHYVLNINKLLKEIDPEQSTWKIKTDMIVVSAAKVEHVNWSHVTEIDKRASDAKKIVPETDKEADPSEGLMSIMKNMYEQGDDEMKRTIAKAWSESQSKLSTTM